MDTKLKQGSIRKYEKPATKKHDALDTVQGSALYYSGLYSGGLYYTYTSLYYYY